LALPATRHHGRETGAVYRPGTGRPRTAVGNPVPVGASAGL